MAPPPQRSTYSYVVGPGDVLDVQVFDEEKLKYTLTVTPDGKISFPLAGVIDVMDRSLADIADMVAARLLKSKGFTDPSLLNVTVILKESKSAQVQIVGEVGSQRAVPYVDRLSLLQAINQAGGVQWRTAKLEAVHVVRGVLDRPTLIEVDLEDVFAGGERDLYLRPGDIIVVPPKYITIFDRYVQQLFSPINSLSGAYSNALFFARSPGGG